MLFVSVINDYLLWHYTRAFKEIFHVWVNFLWFVIHFFSIPKLIRSWFSPWKRMVEDRGETWNFEALAGFIIIGFFSRLIGFILRTIIITIGLTLLLLVFAIGIAVYLLWLVFPFLIIGLLGFGITLLIA